MSMSIHKIALVLCTAAICINAVSSKKVATSCTIATQETRCLSSCECVAGLCVDQELAQEEVNKCQPCADDMDCPGTICDLVSSGRCLSCVLEAMDKGTEFCGAVVDDPVETPLASPDTYSSQPQVKYVPSDSSEETSASEDNEEEELDAEETTADSSEEPEAIIPNAACISTSFLVQNGLQHQVLANYAPATVLCIPNLPCGTPGHLLRNEHNQLVSYGEVCKKRNDCTSAIMSVSKLSHMFDWSTISDGHLKLTSLSAHPDAIVFSVSMVVARLGDILNRHGMGRLTNVFALLPQHVITYNKVAMNWCKLSQ